MVEQLYPRAVEFGVDARLFWEMTYLEILTAMQGGQARRQADLQERALIAFRQCELTATLMGIMLGSKQKAPSLTEAFPGIFPEQPLRQQNWQLIKARMQEQMAARRKRGEQASGSHHS